MLLMTPQRWEMTMQSCLIDDIGFPDVPDETKYKYKKKFSQPVVNMDLGCGDTLNKNHTGELKMLVQYE